MGNNSAKILNRIITALLWILSLYLLLIRGSWYLFGFIFALHTAEIFLVGYKKGTKAGYSGFYSIVMTLIWGFTWWLYLGDEHAS